MERIALVFLFVAGCAGKPSYTGTYAGGFFISLQPSPLTGDPTATGTATLQEVGSSVSGTFDVVITNAGQMSTSTGTMSGTVGGNNAIDDLTLVVDRFSSACTPPQFTAHGSAGLIDDQQDKVTRLSWSANGISTCGGQTTQVSLTAVPGMPRQ